MTNNLCLTCRRRIHWACEAFPDGIPQPILDNRSDHREPYPGDRGIRYEPVPASAIEKELAKRAVAT